MPRRGYERVAIKWNIFSHAVVAGPLFSDVSLRGKWIPHCGSAEAQGGEIFWALKIRHASKPNHSKNM
jgi:hypothetical protein